MTCTRAHTLVTGASSGIGRATALRLAAAGQHVYAGVRTEADAAALAQAAAGWELTPVILDVTDPVQIAAAATTVTDHVGPAGLDGLVNNAGIGVAAPTELLPLDTFRRLLEINVVGQLAVTQTFLPLLRAARGRIVVISTIGVRFRPPFAGPLDATKAALAELAHALRQELAPWGIRVILIEPASIASAAADKVARGHAGPGRPGPPRPLRGHLHANGRPGRTPGAQRQPARGPGGDDRPGADRVPPARPLPDREVRPPDGRAQPAADAAAGRAASPAVRSAGAGVAQPGRTGTPDLSRRRRRPRRAG